MKTLGYRSLLAAVMLLVHVFTLVLMPSTTPQRGNARIDSAAGVQTVAYQEDTATPFEPPQTVNFSTAQKVDLLLNYPAFLAAIPFVIAVPHKSDLFLWYAMTPFVRCSGSELDGGWTGAWGI